MPLQPLYSVDGHPMLGEKYNNLVNPDEAVAHVVLAEMLLGLKAPVYTGEPAERLKFAIAIQVNFQLQQGVEPDVLKSVSNTHPGNTTQYRDRMVSPDARALTQYVTGNTPVGFRPPGLGV